MFKLFNKKRDNSDLKDPYRHQIYEGPCEKCHQIFTWDEERLPGVARICYGCKSTPSFQNAYEWGYAQGKMGSNLAIPANIADLSAIEWKLGWEDGRGDGGWV